MKTVKNEGGWHRWTPHITQHEFNSDRCSKLKCLLGSSDIQVITAPTFDKLNLLGVPNQRVNKNDMTYCNKYSDASKLQNIAVTQGGYLSVCWGETRGNFLKKKLKKRRNHLCRAVQRNPKWLGNAGQKWQCPIKKDGDDRGGRRFTCQTYSTHVCVRLASVGL